jgi:predicted negative regulator of RcsB-dependent stress response
VIRAALIAIAVATSVTPAGTNQPAPVHPAVPELLTEWVAAVQSHTPGAMDDAVGAIAAWNRSELLLAQPFVRAMADTIGTRWRSRPLKPVNLTQAEILAIAGMAPLATSETAANDFIKRAALLHTDALLVAPLFPAPARPARSSARSELFLDRPEELVIARGPDGQFANFELGSLHWEYARDLLDAVTPAPASDATVALWYRAVMASFASSYSFGEVLPHIYRARQLAANDPGVLFGDAAIQETLASPRIQDYVRVTTLPNAQRFLLVTSQREHLELAEALLRRALQRDPAFAEARIRLARVLSQRGLFDAALAGLNAVPPQADPVLAYYALLIRGDAERALKQYDAARRSYQQALALFPTAQSARLALGHLARVRSDREGAMAMLQPTLLAAVPRDDDPWWDYHRGDGRNVQALLRQLRAPFLKRVTP